MVTPIGWGWGSASLVAQGTCAGVIQGGAPGSIVTCTVLGLNPGTSYDFQMVTYRGSMENGTAVFGPLSSPTTGVTTAAAPAPPAPPAAPSIGSVAISPDGGSITVGSTLQLSAVARDAAGTVISNPSLTWSSLATGVATVNGSGRVTARAAGVALIVVAGVCCGADTVSVTVNAAAAPPPPPAVGTIEITPDGGTIVGIGSTLQLSATARDSQGNIISNPTLNWTSLSNVVASVNASGRVTANASGTVRIAVSGSCCGADTVTVVVTSSPALPPTPATSAWFEETWSYSGTSAMKSAIHYASTGSTLQSGSLFDGSVGSFARTQYPGGGNEGTATVQLSPPRADQDRPREIWGEAYVRVPVDWRIKSDDKTLFVMEDWSQVPAGLSGAGEGEVWRWAIYLRSGSWGGPYGGPYYHLQPFENPPNMEAEVFTGQWVRLRYHFKMASNTTATDGIYQVWIGDRLVTSRTGIRTDSAPQAYFRVVILGANADPIGSGTRDWGRVQIHTSNPGW